MPKKPAKVKKSKKDMSQEELSGLLKKSLENSELKKSGEELENSLDNIDPADLEFHPLLNTRNARAPVLEQIAGDGSVATPIFVAQGRTTKNSEEDSEIKYESVGKEDSKYSAGHEYESPNIREATNIKDFSTREVSMDTSLIGETRQKRWAAEETFATEKIRDQRVSPFESQSQEKKYKEPKHKKL